MAPEFEAKVLVGNSTTQKDTSVVFNSRSRIELRLEREFILNQSLIRKTMRQHAD